MRRALVCSCFGFAGLAIADAAEGDGFSRHSKLEEVRYETLLMEKKLEYAKLELEELRTRHERDMRATAVSEPAVFLVRENQCADFGSASDGTRICG